MPGQRSPLARRLCLIAALGLVAPVARAEVDELARLDDEALVAFHEHAPDARERLHLAVERGSSNARVHLYLGLAERAAGDLDAAIAILRGALEHPSDLERELGLELAVTLSWAGRFEEAQQQYERRLEIDPGDRVARVGRARMLAWQGHLGPARRALVPLVTEEPDDVEAQLELASVEAAAMRKAAAREAYSAVLALDPDNDRARRGLDALRRMPRVQLDAEGGYARVAGQHNAGTGSLGVAVDVRSWLRVDAGYSTFVVQVQDPVLAARASQQHSIQAGAVVNWRRRLYAGPRYRLLLAEGTQHHAFGLDLAARPHDLLTLSGSVRPGLWAEGGFDLLTRASVEMMLAERVWPSVHWYHYVHPARDQVNDAVVGKVGVRVVQRLTLTAGGGWLYASTGHGWTAMGEAGVDLSARVALFGRYEWYRGAFSRHWVGLGARVRL